ncbi:MAG: hypothetical protein JNL43_07815 [Flavobacteriales bacterium]|nr:hypothetical protein [Flavobacteriales bacterium]
MPRCHTLGDDNALFMDGRPNGKHAVRRGYLRPSITYASRQAPTMLERFSHHILLLVTGFAFGQVARAQGAEPFVDHWDPERTIKRSEGLMVNGREWGEWKFYDRQGRLTEQADFRSGERNGHVRIFHDNGNVQHDGWFKFGKEDSVRVSRYRDGRIMERGSYVLGKKTGTWSYYYPDSLPMLVEHWKDSTMTVSDAWDHEGKHILKEGKGRMETYFASGSILEECDYVNGLKDGPCTEFHPAGNPKARGAYRAGQKQGPWEYWYSNSKLEKKDGFDNGKLDGRYELWFRSGQVNVEGWHKAGEKDSVWTWYTTLGTKDQEGPFKAGLRQGVWKYWYPGTDPQKAPQLSATGAFAADKEEGEWVYFYEGGQFWKKGTYKQGVKDGAWTTWYESGQKLQEGPYLNGKEEGEWHSWFENGQQKTIGTFAEGHMNGLWRGFFPDGQPDFEGYYAKDLKNGAWKLYTESPPGKDIGGRVKEEGSYTEGKKSGRWVTYNINGIAVAEGSYSDGTPTGQWTYFDDAGVKLREQGLLNGNPEGLCTVYDQRGRVIQQMNYRNGRLHGKMTVYDTDGKAVKTTEYEDGSVKKAPPPPDGKPRGGGVPGGR